MSFYVRVKSCIVSFPLPPTTYPAKRYLHVARAHPGREAAGPAAHLRCSADTVVGLVSSMLDEHGVLLAGIRLVLHVPATRTVNPRLSETQGHWLGLGLGQGHWLGLGLGSGQGHSATRYGRP